MELWSQVASDLKPRESGAVPIYSIHQPTDPITRSLPRHLGILPPLRTIGLRSDGIAVINSGILPRAEGVFGLPWDQDLGVGRPDLGPGAKEGGCPRTAHLRFLSSNPIRSILPKPPDAFKRELD